MTPHRALLLALPAALSLLPSLARAQTRDGGWRQGHPLALGARASVRAGDYALVGLGGHLRVQPHRLVTLELFADHFVGTLNDALRHDHEVGGIVQLNVLRGDSWALYPLLGACATLAFVHSPQSGGPTVNDIHFGVRVGAGGQVSLGRGFGLQAQVEALGYLGHPFQVYRFTAQTAPDLALYGLGQLTTALNYSF
ncbi:MAG: hypothetical protein HY909_21470 [Deltaproteobacteria bacterium]|nr:hypothetical protein [Deltaproteobacteria bacterium]